VYFGNLDWRSVGSVGHRSVWTRENDTGPDDANHAQQGMFILSSRLPGAPRGERSGMRIYDVLPTLCDLLEITPPAGLSGRSLLMDGSRGRTDLEQLNDRRGPSPY